MKKSKIYETLERTIQRIHDAGGACIVVAHDGESENTMIAPILQNVEVSTSLFVGLFERFPEFIPRALCAASMVMRDDYDGGSDDDDDPEDDGVPVDGCGVGCAVCMN